MSTARFATLVVVLLVMIGATIGTLVALMRSDSKPSASGADRTGDTSAAESVSDATTNPAATVPPTPTPTATLAPEPVLGARFSAATVEIGKGVTIVAQESNGVGLTSATLTVDGRAVPVTWVRSKASWTTIWPATGREGTHALDVTVASHGVTKTVTTSVTVRLPVEVARAVARIQELIDAFKHQDLAAARSIQDPPPTDLSGDVDVSDGKILYVSHTVPSPNVYDIRAGYVVHQLVPPGDPGAGEQDTAYFCGVWRVNANVASGPTVHFVKVVAIEQRTTEKVPVGNAPPGWLPFESYRARLGECASMNLG
jgi:hypothetical protein